jgi:hypothetical protein
MQLINGMMAYMHKVHSADVALTYARGYAAPTGGCLTAVVPSCVEATPCRVRSTDMRQTKKE